MLKNTAWVNADRNPKMGSANIWISLKRGNYLEIYMEGSTILWACEHNRGTVYWGPKTDYKRTTVPRKIIRELRNLAKERMKVAPAASVLFEKVQKLSSPRLTTL